MENNEEKVMAVAHHLNHTLRLFSHFNQKIQPILESIKRSNMMKSAIVATLAATAAADPMNAPIHVSDVVSGNFTIASVNMVPGHSWQSWSSGTTAILDVKGSTAKKILAGTFKWQMYETGVTSFIASGNSPYFLCDNKGCDPSSGIALKFTKGTIGAFDLSLTLALPSKAGSSNDFRLVIWGEDQDHNPYDFSATINFSYKSTIMKAKNPMNMLAAQQMQVHHDNNNDGDGPNAHCEEMTITQPSTNEYWKAHSYQYPATLWPRGPCDHKKYNYFNRKTAIAKGVSMSTFGIHHSEGSMKVQDANEQDAPDCSDNKCLYLITNPTSPMGKQHCQELDNPEGTAGGYWKSKGWKYTSPPWTQGKCDRNHFNYVNRETQNLDGFEGVTFWYLGVQV